MPWIFMVLMLINGVYFGWKFIEGEGPQAGAASVAQQEGVRVSLLSERPDLLTKVAPAAEAPEASEAAPASAPPVVAVVKQCFNVGPFISEPELRKLAGSLRGKGFVTRTDTRKVDEKDFWVFIPPFTSRTKAEERLRDLRAQGIEGFVVKEGVFVNAISLNHFSRKDLADAFLGQMQKVGVVVEYREITKPAKQFWLYAAPGNAKGDLRGAIDDYLTSHQDVRKEITACEE